VLLSTGLDYLCGDVNGFFTRQAHSVYAGHGCKDPHYTTLPAASKQWTCCYSTETANRCQRCPAKRSHHPHFKHCYSADGWAEVRRIPPPVLFGFFMWVNLTMNRYSTVNALEPASQMAEQCGCFVLVSVVKINRHRTRLQWSLRTCVFMWATVRIVDWKDAVDDSYRIKRL